MDIREFVGYLRVAKGPSSNGEYLCKCPAHDDRTASLCIGTGADGRILVKCQAGCDTRDVVKAMGLKMSDLYPEGSKPTSTGKRKPAPRPAPPPPPPPANGPIRQRPLGDLVKVYPYTDESGAVLFEVCRFEAMENGQRVKTFRQRHKDPSNPKAKQGGYVWNISGVRSVIYRLPEVLAAIRDGRTVYLVEGEKDADTLAAAGFAATTNPGGASKSGASKWLPEHSKFLTGAHVVILPDNDAAGVNDRKQVAAQLAAVAKSVKLLDLRKACPSLPTKGDISDMLEIMGTAPGLKALKALESVTEPMDISAAQATAARDAAAALIGNLPGYCVDHGRICTWSDDSPKPLCTFTAITNGVVTRDNGVDEETWLLVDGWTASGEPLKQARVKASAFKPMNWVTENWDIRATIMPGNTATDKVRFVIANANAQDAQRIREYTHTGWRKIGGRWCFLYQGGAIGAEGVTVDLTRGLERYHMGNGFTPEPGNEIDAMTDVYLLSEIIPRRISVPLIAFMFLAPLRDALLRAGFPPTFSVYLIGGSGTHKSTLSALMLSFFGSFTESSLPASFNDTGNYIRSLAFSLKDMVLAVDDYHPEGNLQARRKMEYTAQQLSRAFGDLAQRGRMMSDQTLATAKPPRSLALISGEDMPNVRESGEARYYVIQIGKDDIHADKGLTEMQDRAASGAQAYVMRKYIEWLAPQMDELPAKLGERFKELRSQFQGAKLGHTRAPGTVAHLIIGYEMYMRFLIASGVVDDPDGELLRSEVNEAVRDIIANSAAQGRESRAERPSRMFLNTIGEMLLTKEASVLDLTDTTAKSTGGKISIGYMDAMYYYLIPDTSYRVVCEFFTKKGEAFPLSSRMLHKQMEEDGFIQCDSAGKRSRVKTINGRGVRTLWIPRDCVDGPKPVKEQLRMDLTAGEGGEGFKEVPNDSDNPF